MDVRSLQRSRKAWSWDFDEEQQQVEAVYETDFGELRLTVYEEDGAVVAALEVTSEGPATAVLWEADYDGEIDDDTINTVFEDISEFLDTISKVL